MIPFIKIEVTRIIPLYFAILFPTLSKEYTLPLDIVSQFPTAREYPPLIFSPL
jgi:hypothetical protein